MSAAVLKLYDTVDELATVREFLLEADEGELTPEMEQLLDHALGQFEDKVQRVGLVVRELKVSAKAIQEEADRIAAKAKRAERAAASLMAYLKAQLERADVKKVEGQLVTVRLQANPPSVKHALDSAAIAALGEGFDDVVKIIPQTYALDAKAVITRWKAGEPLPAGVAVEQGTHLRIG